MILPAAAVKDADSAARKTISSGIFPGRQITVATITDVKVIRKFTGREIIKIAFSFSFNAYKILLRDSLKLTKRKRFNDVLKVKTK